MVHTKIWISNQVVSLTPLSRLLYIGLVTLADDYGRFRADEQFLNAQIFPYDKLGAAKVKTMRMQIEEAGLIRCYQAGKVLYGFHPNWERHQTFRSDRPRISEIPAPPSPMLHPEDNQLAAEDKVSQENEMEDKVGEVRTSLNARSAMLSGMPNGGKGSLFYRNNAANEL